MPRIETKNLQEDADVMLTYAQAAVYFIEAFGMLPPELLADKFLNLSADQQEIFSKFLTDDYAKIKEAKLKTIQKAGEKPTISAPSNGKPASNNKKQGELPFNETVDAFIALGEELHQEMIEEGVNLPAFDPDAERMKITQSLSNILTISDT
jgi:hypothetical protein